MLLVAPGVAHPEERGPPRGTIEQRTADGGVRVVTYASSEVLAPHPGQLSATVVYNDGYDRSGLIRRFQGGSKRLPSDFIVTSARDDL